MPNTLVNLTQGMTAETGAIISLMEDTRYIQLMLIQRAKIFIIKVLYVQNVELVLYCFWYHHLDLTFRITIYHIYIPIPFFFVESDFDMFMKPWKQNYNDQISKLVF